MLPLLWILWIQHLQDYTNVETETKKFKLSVDVTAVDPNPSCDPSPESSSVDCRFTYIGNSIPDFEWLISESTTSNDSCNVYDSPTIGSLRIKGYERTAGHCSEGDSDKVYFPLNHAAVKGEMVRLNCSTQKDYYGFWFRIIPLTADEILIHHRKVVKNGLFSVDESVPGRSDLLFTSSKHTAGRYGCDSVEASITAEVVVLDPQPSCSKETKSDVVNASCTVEFSGNWPPVIEWTDPTGKLKQNSTNIVPNHRVTSFLIVPLNEDHPHDVHLVTCFVKFSLTHKPRETKVKNVPELDLNSCSIAIGASEFEDASGESEVELFESTDKSEFGDGYLQTESRYEIVLLGGKVDLDCIADKSYPPTWYFKPDDSNVSELLIGSSEALQNASTVYRIVTENIGHIILIIDPVESSLAGIYECRDGDKMYKLSVDVTVVDPNPSCDQRPENSSIDCNFQYFGHLIPEFEWLTSESMRGISLCNISDYDSSTIRSMRIKSYKIPDRHCVQGDTGELSTPLNYAAVNGEKVRLNCSTRKDYTGYWFRNLPPAADDILIYHKNKVKNSMFLVIESVPGRTDLLFVASERTAGRYGCDSVEATVIAEVIVLDPQPRCSKKVIGGIVNASCSIGFSGNWPPVIEWTDAVGHMEANATVTIPSSRVTSFLIVPANVYDPQDMYLVTCTVKFNIEDKPPEITLTNIPVISVDSCRITIEASDHGEAAGAIDYDQVESKDHGEAAGAINLDQVERKEITTTGKSAGGGKLNPIIGSGSFVLLQLSLIFVAAFVGFVQF